MKLIIKSIVALVLVMLAFSKVFADQLPVKRQNESAYQALQRSFDDATNRVANIKPQHRFRFVNKLENEQGDISYQQFNPVGKNDGTWKNLQGGDVENQMEGSAIAISSDFIFEPKGLDVNKAQFIEETDSTWVFHMPHMARLNSEDLGNAVDEEKLNEELNHSLLMELVINKETGLVSSIHIFAPKPFSPEFLVKVERFSIKLFYKEAWQDGPLICYSQSKHLIGSYGLFFDIEESLLSTTVEYKLIKAENI